MIDHIEKLTFTRCGKTYRPVAYRERCLDSADNQFGDYTHNVLFADDDRAEFVFCCLTRDGKISFSSGPMEGIRVAGYANNVDDASAACLEGGVIENGSTGILIS